MKKLTALGLLCATLTISPVAADTLDDVIEAGKVRCAIVLDFPPMGFRNDAGEPDGFDVAYCRDLAASLDVDYEIVPVTWAERLPAIVDGKADVVFAGTSITLQRARTVGFTIPYAVFFAQAVVGGDTGITSFAGLRGKRVGAAATTLQEKEFLARTESWGDERDYTSFPDEEAVFKALIDGDIDAAIVTNTEIPSLLAENDTLVAGPRMPWPADVTAVAGPRLDVSWLNYLNLFVVNQVRYGRYEDLWTTYVGGNAPDLTIPGVAY